MTASFWYISIPWFPSAHFDGGGANAQPDLCCETFIGGCRAAFPRLIPIVFRALFPQTGATAHDVVPIRLTSQGEVNRNSNRTFAMQIAVALSGEPPKRSAPRQRLRAEWSKWGSHTMGAIKYLVMSLSWPSQRCWGSCARTKSRRERPEQKLQLGMGWCAAAG